MWFFGPKSVRLYAKQAKHLADKGIKLVLLQNSQIEFQIGRLAGFPCYLINQNIHVNEHVFQPRPAAKEYDAIYTSAAARYKRIHLGLGIRRLFVLTYFWPDKRDASGKWNLELFDPRLRNVAHNREKLEPQEIAPLLNTAGCGLALSLVEGAMYASMEYLLCGLPVVTTRNVGGRDFFLNSSNSVHVRATRAAVASAVADVSCRTAGGDEIREAVLNKVVQLRWDLAGIVSSYTARKDVASLSESWWAAPSGIAARRLF